MSLKISKMTKDEAKLILEKVRKEIYRRSGFNENTEPLLEPKFRNFNGIISSDPDSLKLDWSEFEGTDYDNEIIRAAHGKKIIDSLLKICDFDDAKFTKELDTIPGAFDFNDLQNLTTELSSEDFNLDRSSCRAACTGLCHSACTNSCINGCSDECTSCTGTCKRECTVECSEACDSSCGKTCGTGCGNTAISSCSNCTGGCSGCTGCTGCVGSCTGCGVNCDNKCSGSCRGNCSSSNISGYHLYCGCGNNCYTGCGSIEDSDTASNEYYSDFMRTVSFYENGSLLEERCFEVYGDNPTSYTIYMPNINSPFNPNEENFFTPVLMGWTRTRGSTTVEYGPRAGRTFYCYDDSVSPYLSFYAIYKKYIPISSQSIFEYNTPTSLTKTLRTITSSSDTISINQNTPVNIAVYDKNNNRLLGLSNLYSISINNDSVPPHSNDEEFLICNEGSVISVRIDSSDISRIEVSYYDCKRTFSDNSFSLYSGSILKFEAVSALFKFNADGTRTTLKRHKCNSISNGDLFSLIIDGNKITVDNNYHINKDCENNSVSVTESFAVARDGSLLCHGFESLKITVDRYSESSYILTQNY